MFQKLIRQNFLISLSLVIAFSIISFSLVFADATITSIGTSSVNDTEAYVYVNTTDYTSVTLYWGTSGSGYPNSTSNSGTNMHYIQMSSLSPGTTYYYYASADDGNGGTYTSGEYSLQTTGSACDGNYCGNYCTENSVYVTNYHVNGNGMCQYNYNICGGSGNDCYQYCTDSNASNYDQYGLGSCYYPPPSVSINSPSSNDVLTSWSPSVSWGNSNYCYYSFDGNYYNSLSNCSESIPAPSEGQYINFYIKGSNSGGDGTASVSSLTYDATPPSVSIAFPANGEYLNSATYFYANWGDSMTCSYSFDNFTNSISVPCSYSNNFVSTNEEGGYTLSIRGIDSVGNSADSSVSFTVTNDTAPTVSSVTTTSPNGGYSAGDIIPITFTFSEAVTTSGTVIFYFNSLGACTLNPITNSTTGTCNYTVGSGDNASQLYITNGSGTINDADGGPVLPVTNYVPFSNDGLSGIRIDNTLPRYNLTTSKTSGTYGIGTLIAFTVSFIDTVLGSDPITSTTTSTLTLNSGGTCQFGALSGATSATCNYTVAEGNYTPSPFTSGNKLVAVTNGLAGTFSDSAGNFMTNFSASSNMTSRTIYIDGTRPTVSVTAPANGATVSGASVSLTANATDTVGTISGVQFKRATTTNIGSEDTTSTYGVTWDSTAVVDGSHTLIAVARDSTGNYATSTAITVTVDNTGPIASTLSPLDNSTDISISSNLVITFNENVDVETGNIIIKKTSDNSTVETIAINGAQVTGTGTNTITINPTANLDYSTGYYVQIAATAIDDAQSNSYAGIANTTSWSFTTEASPDSDGPVITNIVETPSTTLVVIDWDTDEASDSLVEFGLISTYTASSTFDSDLVTDHSVTLSNLKSCSLYHYRVVSKDTLSNRTNGSDGTFETTGCAGSASIEDTTTSDIDTSVGETVTYGSSDVVLDVPVGVDSNSSLIFQIVKLSGNTVIPVVGSVSDKSLVGDFVYNLSAFSDATTTVTSFDSAITVTMSYDDADVSGLEESSLLIYRWGGSSWNALSNCSVNTVANTISCETTNFSTFGIFGSAQTSSRFSYGSVYKKPNKILEKKTQFIFSKDLKQGMIDAEVKELQKYLNSINFKVSLLGPGSIGNETTYFGEATRSALAKYQIFKNIIPSVGYFGPITRETINNRESKDLAPAETLKIDTSIPTNILLTKSMYQGVNDPEVKLLQEFLNRNGFLIVAEGPGSKGNETSYFGELTKQAVIKFQLGNNIISSESDPYAGFVGPNTREKINNLK